MIWMRAGRIMLAAAATGLLMACGGDDEPTGSTGSIQVGVLPAALSIQQGSSGSVTAVVTRSGDFTGSVTLAIAGLPTGVTSDITPSQLPGTTSTALVEITVPATAAPGAFTATITGTAQGVSQVTTTLQVTVIAGPS
jgi:uncharacterized membrane protein